MAASLDNPEYTVYLVEKDHKYNITPAVTAISFSNQEKQVAQSVSINATNIKTSSGKTICELIDVRKRIFIYANDGEKKEEVFRGWVWTSYHRSQLDDNLLTIKCYDNLIYLQESEDSLYFSKGKSTKSITSTICDKWGIKLNYSYSTITHGKLVLRGNLTDIFMSDILDTVKRRTGKKYVIYSQKDVMYISGVGTNTEIYQITKKNNAIEVRNQKTMDGMVTKVKILGNADKDSDKVPVVATVKGDTSKYGTLQKLQTKGTDDSLADAKEEATTTINEHGSPTTEYMVIATDIPWIKKGDTVYVEAGHITGKNLIVVGIERSISNKAKTMELTLSEATITKASATSSSGSGEKAAWFDAMETQFNWSKKQTYRWVSPSVSSSKSNGTCITFVAVSLQRIGYLPEGKYFYAHPNTGKMVGNAANYVKNHSDKFKYSYPKKTVKQLANEGKIEPGDIVSFKDPAYHTMVFMGFNKSGRPIFNTMGHTRGLKITYRNYESRKVDLLVRLKL